MRSKTYAGTSPAQAAMEFTQEQIEDVTDAFEIFSRTPDLLICYDQVGDMLRALKLNPTQEDVEKILGNPSKEEMSSKMLKQEEFLTIYEKALKDCEQGTYDDLVEGLRVFDKEGDGTVMGGEIRHVLRTLGEKMTVSEISEVMDGWEDMNGVLKIEAFCKFLMTENKEE